MSERIEHAGCQIEIWQDEDCEDPRKWDNLGTMVCFHSRYTLGDKHGYGRPPSWETLLDTIRAEEGPVIRLPVLMYEHSGVILGTRREYPFTCPWDAGQVGVIYVNHKRIQAEYGDVSPETCLQAAKVLRAEVETYSQYVSGQCYGYTLMRPDGEKDCVGGFIGYEHCLEDAKQQAEYFASMPPYLP